MVLLLGGVVVWGGRRHVPGPDLAPVGPICVLAARLLAWLRRLLHGEEELEQLGQGIAAPKACLLQHDDGSFAGTRGSGRA